MRLYVVSSTGVRGNCLIRLTQYPPLSTTSKVQQPPNCCSLTDCGALSITPYTFVSILHRDQRAGLITTSSHNDIRYSLYYNKIDQKLKMSLVYKYYVN